MPAKILDIKTPEAGIIHIRPVRLNFTLNKTYSKGFVAYDPLGNRVFHYPIETDPKDTLAFLKDCIINGSSAFKAMMIRGYVRKYSVIIGQETIPWSHYEFLFAKQVFYSEIEPAEILDINA